MSETRKGTERHPFLELEYKEASAHVRQLADIRFKLLGLVPTLGGGAIALVGVLGAREGTTDEGRAVALLAAAVGFGVTLGITMYDQRNSELYNAVIHRLKFLESLFDAPASPGARRETPHGGVHSERPKRGVRTLRDYPFGHDTALAAVYSSVLGGWVAVGVLAAGSMVSDSWMPSALGLTAGALAATGFFTWLEQLDQADARAWKDAGGGWSGRYGGG